MTNASVVVCLDASGSMGDRHYFEPAKTDAATFVNIMTTGDSLGVTAFSDDAWIAYLASSQTVVPITSQDIQTAATTAIMRLQSTFATNIAAGLILSGAMLKSAATPKAIVLLSDGEYNVGPDPIQHLPPMAVHTIGLGDIAPVETLRRIASLTGGTFHIAPTAFDLAEIYNDIIGVTDVATVLANNKEHVDPNKSWSLAADIPEGTPEVTFAVCWLDWAITYTPDVPVGKQLRVTFDVADGPVEMRPPAIGNGFVVFKVQDPQPGPWKLTAHTSATMRVSTTGGIFIPSATAKLHVDAPMTVDIGESVTLNARVLDRDGSTLPDVDISASLEAPSMDADQAVKNNRARLDALPPLQTAKEDSDNVRMLALQMQLGPGERLLPYDQMTLGGEVAGDGGRRFVFMPKHQGAHVVRLQASGRSAKSGRNVCLTRRISMWAGRK